MLQRPRRGVQLIEFSLVLPLMLIVLGGILDVGNYLDQYLRVVEATTAAAREAAALPTTTSSADLINAAESQAVVNFAAVGLPAATTSATYGNVGGYPTLAVQSDLPVAPLFGFYALAPTSISYTALFRVW